MSLLPTVNARGLLAARPAAIAANEGYNFYATDTGMLYRSNGASWDVNSSGFTNPMTTAGDIIYGGASGVPTRLAIGVAARVLTVNAGATAPEWAAAGGGSAVFVGVWANKTATFPSLVDNTFTTLAFDGADDYDTDAYHDPVTNNSRLTVPASKAGKYVAWCSVSFAPNATGRRAVGLMKNGVLLIVDAVNAVATSAKDTQRVVTFPPLVLIATDYLEVQAIQNSGGNLATSAQQFGMYAIGPVA